MLVSALLVVALGALGLAVSHLVSENLGTNVARVPDVFAPLDPATRPAESRSLTFLLAGTDSRSAAPGTGTTATGAGGRGDVLMIARLNPDRTAAAVAAIPRDSWVDIPHHGVDRIDAAYALGGPALLIGTVENLTRIRIDQFAVIDFAGIQAMVDAVGGIDVAVGTATSNDGVTFRAGANHLDGRGALAYVGPRDGVSDGDLDRAQRQQNALRAPRHPGRRAGHADQPGRYLQAARRREPLGQRRRHPQQRWAPHAGLRPERPRLERHHLRPRTGRRAGLGREQVRGPPGRRALGRAVVRTARRPGGGIRRVAPHRHPRSGDAMTAGPDRTDPGGRA